MIVSAGASTSTSRRRGLPRRTSASSSSPPASPSWESSTDSGACSGFGLNDTLWHSKLRNILGPPCSVSSAWISWSIHQPHVILWRMIESLPPPWLDAESLLTIPNLFPHFCPYPSLPPSPSSSAINLQQMLLSLLKLQGFAWHIVVFKMISNPSRSLEN